MFSIKRIVPQKNDIVNFHKTKIVGIFLDFWEISPCFLKMPFETVTDFLYNKLRMMI